MSGLPAWPIRLGWLIQDVLGVLLGQAILVTPVLAKGGLVTGLS